MNFDEFNKIYVQISKALDGLTEEQKFAVLLSIINVECKNYILEDFNGETKKSNEE